jgi:regulator of cell morphogenesis and NO signaling
MIDRGHRTLGDVVSSNPASARIFESLGLDFCCHGDRRLDAACEEAGLDVDEVVDRLAAAGPAVDTSWSGLGIPALADHILATHHAYLHEELPLLEALAGRVEGVHGERHPELSDVRRLVGELKADLEPHMLKEERVLFPAVHALHAGQTEFAFGSVGNPIRMMMFEHERCGELLAALRTATDGFSVPDDACASYRSLYERLGELEQDTHLHIHKENNVLFPAAIALSEQLQRI